MEKTVVNEEKHSVKYTINNKGLIAGELKCYGEFLEATEERARQLQMKMKSYITQQNAERV